MKIFNIGPLELILILVVMFILLGPTGMQNTARQIGKWIRQVIRSPMWGEIMGYSRELRDLPTKIVRDTGLEEDMAEIRKATQATTDELNSAVSDANKEITTGIDQSLKESGNVEIAIGLDPDAPVDKNKSKE